MWGSRAMWGIPTGSAEPLGYHHELPAPSPTQRKRAKQSIFQLALTHQPVYKTTQDAADSGTTFDYILCANKAFLDAVPSLADILRPVVSANTAIVLLQNGAGAEAPLHAAFPDTTIISAVVWTGAKVLPTENGVATLQQFASEGLTIGVDYTPTSDRDADRKKLTTLTGWLEKAGGECTTTEDIQTDRWVKLVWCVGCERFKRQRLGLGLCPSTLQQASTGALG
jgi:ketopantoate reductase